MNPLKKNIEKEIENSGRAIINKLTTIAKPKQDLIRRGKVLDQDEIVDELAEENVDKVIRDGNIHKVIIPRVADQNGDKEYIPKKKNKNQGKKFNQNKKSKV